jgi:type III secretion protein S
MISESQIVYCSEQCLIITLLLSFPTILVAAVVGTLVSLIQALTQIQEQTLGFVVKLFSVCMVILLSASWMGRELHNYMINMISLMGS